VDRSGDGGADLVDVVDRLDRRLAERARLRKWRASSIAARSPTKRMPRPEDEPTQLPRLARLDRFEQVPRPSDSPFFAFGANSGARSSKRSA
jgi:hypothetical protein